MDSAADSETSKFVSAMVTCESYPGNTGAVISHFSAELGHDWKRLGIGLKLCKTDLDGIECANPYVLEDQISALFVLWRKRNGRNATAEALKAAAQSAGLDELIASMADPGQTGTNKFLKMSQISHMLFCTVHAWSEPVALESNSDRRFPEVSKYSKYLKGTYISDLPLANNDQRWEPVPVAEHISLSLVTNDDLTREEEIENTWIMWDAVQDTARPIKKKKKPIDMKKVM